MAPADRADFAAQPPLIVTDGDGAHLRDIDGNEYIDLMSTPTRAQALGYDRTEIAAAMYRQLERLPYAGTAWQAADVTIELAAKLAEMAPGHLVATAFSGSGSRKLTRARSKSHGAIIMRALPSLEPTRSSRGGALTMARLEPRWLAVIFWTSATPASRAYLGSLTSRLRPATAARLDSNTRAAV